MHEKHKEELENEDLQALSAKILELEKWFQQIPGAMIKDLYSEEQTVHSPK